MFTPGVGDGQPYSVETQQGFPCPPGLGFHPVLSV